VLQRQNRDVVGSLVALSVELKETLSDTEIVFIGAVRDRLQRHTLAAQKICDDPACTEAAREQAILDQSNGFASEIETAIQQAQAAGHAATLERLQRIRGAMYKPEALLPMRMRVQARSALPLRYAAEHYDVGAQATHARMDAYRRALPLRTSMQEDESVDEYVKRATTPGMRPERDMPGVILGDALAESALGTGVSVGDSISVMVPLIYMKDGRLTAETEEVWFRVTGFFRSGLYEENRARMYCDFEELARLLTGSETQYTVGARVADYTIYEGQHRGDDLKRDLRTALREAGVVAPYVSVWEDESRTLLEAVNTERTLIQLIVSFIILLTGGVIFILVYQLVSEKVKDIGILKALGYSPWGIRSVFMFNALFIGLFGALAGGLAGMFTSQYLNQVEDFIDQTTGYRLFPPEVYYLTYIPSIKGWELLELGMNIVVPVVLFSFLCGIYPALLAAKKDPVEALHYE
jgi:ABC-type lipoprotein release transport system permease subunit